MNDALLLYDWLHLHHEDFTGQYGKFYRAYRNAAWYIQQQKTAEKLAASLGYNKVSKQKLAVAQKIRAYVLGGGFMFAMCSATRRCSASTTRLELSMSTILKELV